MILVQIFNLVRVFESACVIQICEFVVVLVKTAKHRKDKNYHKIVDFVVESFEPVICVRKIDDNEINSANKNISALVIK